MEKYKLIESHTSMLSTFSFKSLLLIKNEEWVSTITFQRGKLELPNFAECKFNKEKLGVYNKI